MQRPRSWRRVDRAHRVRRGRPSHVALGDVLGDDAITVGSFDFPESVLLAELYSQALEDRGFRVERALGLGPREFVGPALARRTDRVRAGVRRDGGGFFSAGAVAPSADPAANHRALARVVAGTASPSSTRPRHRTPTPSSSREDTARRYGLTTLSDLAAVAPELVLGGPPECATRPLCQVGLARRVRADVRRLRRPRRRRTGHPPGARATATSTSLCCSAPTRSSSTTSS